MFRTGLVPIIGRSKMRKVNRPYGLKAEIYSRVLLFGDQSKADQSKAAVILHTASISVLSKANLMVFMINYDRFHLSLKRLQEQHEHYTRLDPSVAVLIREAVMESVIQRFEVCYECLWKAMKRYMIEELGLSSVPNSPKPLLRLANENDLLSGSLAQWFKYANVRTDTSHDYDEDKALACLDLVPDFIADAIQLYNEMTGEPWI